MVDGKRTRTVRLAALAAVVALSPLAGGGRADARDERVKLPIKGALERSEAGQKLDVGIRLYFAEAPHPAPEAELGEFRADKKTRSVGRSDASACEWVFLSALIALQAHAHAVGANAVVGIRSFFKDEALSSDAEYLCDAGHVVANVSLDGKFVRLPAK